MTTSAEVREQLIEALRLNLVGPRPGEQAHSVYAEEILPITPSSWYLTGFLVPYEAPAEDRSDDDEIEALDQLGRVVDGDDDSSPEAASARKAYFPSSMGLSVLVPAATAQLQVKVAWGDYSPIETESESDGGAAPPTSWRRTPREAELVVSLLGHGEIHRSEVPGSEGLFIVVSARPAGSTLPGIGSVSVFLVNHRPPAPDASRDSAYVFQPELSLHALHPFMPRPNLSGHASNDWDDRVADLQYRDAFEYAVGHNVSALAEPDASGRCREVRTSWMPIAQVQKVLPTAIPGVLLEMEALAATATPAELRQKVGAVLSEYAAWIARQQSTFPADPARTETARDLLANAERARLRIAAGLDALEDSQAFEAFRLTNAAMAAATRRRACHGTTKKPEDQKAPAWYPFQLAFLLMNLAGIVDPKSRDRQVVDLLFFPTGGGKTEAYLGLAAFTLLLRRLRDPSIQSAGLAVLLRYTLRLLTLDQLGRAATLVCALELERQQDVEKLGRWPFEIGLWVGQKATPNRMGRKGDDDDHSARRRTLDYQHDMRHSSPIPLENCPWCGSQFDKKSFQLLPTPDEPKDLRVSCINRQCDFHTRRQPAGLPLLAVDDPIYRRLPAFLIATVDKFANLPWVGETAGLFGKVTHHDADGFYGPWRRGVGRQLDRPLHPPDLIIQDELHLISGPLGTLMGLYETAIDALGTTPAIGIEAAIKPKIVASTATVRRAERQIRGLFGRAAVHVFPPPGPDRRDSFFARTAPVSERHPRSYVGIAAQGRNLKVILMAVYCAVLAAGQKAWNELGPPSPDHPADPYMTLLGYFNSLRELGGSRRIVEDEVRSRLENFGRQRRRVGERQGLFANRKSLHDPRELTSRRGTGEVADTKRRLALTFDQDKERLDVVLATNMISVGLDITRLGLMVVLGQPQTASEYIQATSRVGRDDQRPGLVLTLLNLHRPRDRSHYERFTAWHESFYRSVEATSVTPFSPRAIDRGLAALTVALARLGHEGMVAPLGAGAIRRLRGELDDVAETISRRAENHDKELSAPAAETLRRKVRDRVVDLLDTWESLAQRSGDLQYQSEVGVAQRLLYDPLSPELANRPQEARKFKAQRSLRDVEPTVKLWLRNPDGIDSDPEEEAP